MTSAEAELKELREQIRQRVNLFRPDGCVEVVVGPEWVQFQGGSGRVRLVPDVSSRHQTVMLFEAPADSIVPLHRHARAETMIVLSTEPDPARVTAICEGREEYMTTGDIATFQPFQEHGAHSETNCFFLLVWVPGFRPHPEKENHVIWTVSDSVLDLSDEGMSIRGTDRPKAA